MAGILQRSGSRPQLDLSKAEIEGNFEVRDPTILLPNQSDDISHLALDIGGSLIKLVYFSRHEDRASNDWRRKSFKERFLVPNSNGRTYPVLGGRLHFVKFETAKINECLDFISSKQLHLGGTRLWSSETPNSDNAVIKATGGGAYKFADLFKERLGVSIEKEDEMDCLVAGANFLLKAIRHEAFTHIEGQKEFVQIDQNELFPYLLVNIGSGVSIIKVDSDGKFERVSGTNVGGGTYWGLGRLLTNCKSFDELLELSQRGDNRTTDMLVGDIYGGTDYSKIGLSASTIASSFGKAISESKNLEDYRPEDISLSLLLMISYNIGQISYLTALRFGLKRIFFGGFFIRGHAYTMDTISFAVHFWSKGEAKAMFLRHEGFLGALGAFMSYEKHGLDDLRAHQLVERFPMGAPYTGGNIQGPPLGDLNEKISWMEKFVQKGTNIIAPAPLPMSPRPTTGLGGFEVPSSRGDTLRSDASNLNVVTDNNNTKNTDTTKSDSIIEREREMAGILQRSGSRPQLDLSKAEIEGNFEVRDPTILLPNQSDDISHLALDIGGSLIKLVYFSRHEDRASNDWRRKSFKERFLVPNSNGRTYPVLGGRLHFVKFETAKINECLDFISSKQLHRGGTRLWSSETPNSDNAVIKATGGGAYKSADLFKERLGVSIEKEDEMDCLVSGANFLLKAIRHEAFTHIEGQKEFVQIDQNELFPYLLVNIGSGVSIIKVDSDGKFERVSGTNVGGGTYWGLGRLLTNCKSFDELLELSQRGDNRATDMLVGDIYGGTDYSKIGLSASTIASSFGKAISESKNLEDYRPEDISLSLLRMISYNIGQISYLTALRFGLKRIFFGGFFIRGHAYTMDTISFAVHFWSKGEAKAMFLRHEGFLGALGAFMSYEKHGLDDLRVHQLVERFPMGAPYTGGNIQGPPLGDLNEKISWMEKFVQKGTNIIAPAPLPMSPRPTTGLGGFEVPSSRGDTLRSDASNLNVGVLHLVPTLEVFPLLADIKKYEPNTFDLSDPSEQEYWFKVLSDNLPDLVVKAVASEGGTVDAKKRGDAFARAFSAHLARLMEEPTAYGKLGLANLLELREECLREFHFNDVYKNIKQRENEASLAVLPDLLSELDSMDEETRWLTLIEGVLAANIFDWGSHVCVDLYNQGTIIEIYRMSREKMQRPFRVDDFDLFKERILGSDEKKPHLHKRALLFVDNAGADVVLGMFPLAREFLRRGTEVVLVANSLPALNDVTAMELPQIVAEAAKHCDIIRRAAEAGGLLVDAMNIQDISRMSSSSVPLMVVENGCGGPCIDLRQVSSELAAAAKDADLIILEGMGRSLHTNYNARFRCDALKLAMVKNQRLAEKLIQGKLYDCTCRFEPAI